MSAIMILVPAIVAGWPAITAAVAGAAAALGLAVTKEAQEVAAQIEGSKHRPRQVELEVENSEVLEASLATGEQIALTKDDMRIRVFRDERGQLRFCVSGVNRSRQELEQFGHQVVEKVTQIFIYNRVVTELKQKNIQIVREEVSEDSTVHLYVRNTVE